MSWSVELVSLSTGQSRVGQWGTVTKHWLWRSRYATYLRAGYPAGDGRGKRRREFPITPLQDVPVLPDRIPRPRTRTRPPPRPPSRSPDPPPPEGGPSRSPWRPWSPYHHRTQSLCGTRRVLPQARINTSYMKARCDT